MHQPQAEQVLSPWHSLLFQHLFEPLLFLASSIEHFPEDELALLVELFEEVFFILESRNFMNLSYAEIILFTHALCLSDRS